MSAVGDAWRPWRRAAMVLALMASPSLAAAQEYTLNDIVARVHAADSIAGLPAWDPAVHARLVSLDAYFGAQRLGDLTTRSLAVVSTGGTPDFTTILRLDRSAFARLPLGVGDSLRTLRKIAFYQPLKDSVERRSGAAALDSLYAPIDAWTKQALELSLKTNVARLRRYEIKYGPDSPRLNVAEALLNYAAQLPPGSPFAGSEAGPSPLEIVAAYRPVTLATAKVSPDSSTSVRAATSAQVGLRVYTFKEGCGQGSVIQRITTPCHFSLGWFMLGPGDAAPLELWRGHTEHGAYVAIANYHVGMTFGRERRFAVGVDTQVLPYIF